MGADPTRADPVHWWWYGDSGVRVVVVAFDCLVISGCLDNEQLESIDEALRRGSVLDADFGPEAMLVDLSQVLAVRYVPHWGRTVIVTSGGSVCEIEPITHGDDLAREIFDHVASVIAPGVRAREGFVRAPKTSPRRYDGRVPAALGFVAVGVLAISAWADPERISSGPLSGPVQRINDFFVSIGWLPLLLVLVGLLVAETWGLIGARAASSRRLPALQVDVYARAPERRPPASGSRSRRGYSKRPSRMTLEGRREAAAVG